MSHDGTQQCKLAYYAGFVDGEGCIRFNNNGTKAGRSAPTPQITVGNTRREVLEDLMADFGGSIRVLHVGDHRHKPAWVWSIHSSAAASFLRQIYPYLRLKRPQAELIFEWEGHRPGSGHKWDQVVGLSLLERMRPFNRKGPALAVAA